MPVTPSAPGFTSQTKVRSWWPERVASLLAVAGVLVSILVAFHVREWQFSGSDFKTLYASAACLVQGQDAYRFADLAAVFQQQGVHPPVSWYAHAPVYPPFTLALLTPFTQLSMVNAVYAWMLLSAGVFACATASLARSAGEQFGLSRPWRFAMIALCAATPLLSFALEVGNVSVMVCSLCVLAIAAPRESSSWRAAGYLALAFLLKPHLAVWVLPGLLLMRDARSRRLALRATGMAAALVLALSLWVARQHTLFAQFNSFRETLHNEVDAGSMAAPSRDLLSVAAQITSADSLTQYWSPHLHAVAILIVVLLGAAMAVATLRLAPEPAQRIPLLGAWLAVGLVATYHRSHDGLVLVILLPWVLGRLRARWRDGIAWCVAGLLVCVSGGLPFEVLQYLATVSGVGPLANFLLYRQAACAALLLAGVLVVRMLRLAFAAEVVGQTHPARLRAIRA